MTDELLLQALRLTITELTTKLAEELTTKQVLAIQLAESQEHTQYLLARISELESLLDSETTPEKEGNDHDETH